MAENVATLKCIRSHVITFQNSTPVKLIFPALYMEILGFLVYFLIQSGKLAKEYEITGISMVMVIAMAIIVTISCIQMSRLNTKLNQVRYLIFDSKIFEKEYWTESERTTAVEYAKDSMTYMRVNTIAYVIAIINLFCLSILICSLI